MSVSGIPNTKKPQMSSTGSVSFYRKPLFPPCIAFSSREGRRLFREALLEGNMECYFRLAEQFRTQDDPAFCGLSTLTMVLNALAVDPGRVWKGPWRWYHESMLDCCAPLDVVHTKGITLNTFVCLATCNGLVAQVGGPSKDTIEDLRGLIEECSSEDKGKVVVVSYDRRGLRQTGSGHFSPIGGFHKANDHVLILDTARFKLPPHWVPLGVLWEAMKALDPETGNPRGFVVFEKAHELSHRVFTPLSSKYRDWPEVACWVKNLMKLASAGDTPSGAFTEDGAAPSLDRKKGELMKATNVKGFVAPLLEMMSPAVQTLLTTFEASSCGCPGHEQDGFVLQEIQQTEVYREISHTSKLSSDCAHTTVCDSDEVTSPGLDGSRWGCGCLMQHTLTVVTYASLALLHKHHKEISDDEAGPDAVARAWKHDPLATIPDAVAHEARHVASIFEGLIDMERYGVIPRDDSTTRT